MSFGTETVKRLGRLLLRVVTLSAVAFQCAPYARRTPSPARELSLSDLQTQVEQNLRGLQSFRGRARLVLESPGQNFSAVATILVRVPDSILIRVEAAFGIDVGVFFADRSRFTVYSPQENTVYTGAVTPENLGPFLRLNFSLDEMLEVFTGLAALPQSSDEIQPELNREGDEYVVHWNRGNGQSTFWVDPVKGVIRRAEKGMADEPRVVESFSRFQTKKGIVFPKMIQIERPERRERLTVFYLERDANPKLRAKDFRVKLPPGAKWVWVEQGRRQVERP